jgi:NAD(P)H-flavin reductase
MASAPEMNPTQSEGRNQTLASVMPATASAVDPMQPIPYRIRRIHTETQDTFTMQLEPVNGAPGISFAPGQFNMLYVFGVGEVPISVSGDPAKPDTLLHTTRAVGTVTRAMREMKRGDVLGVRGPFGTQWPVAEAAGRDVVVVAGGLGLAPLRPALYSLLAQREKYRRLVLLYGARSPEEILFPHELERWRGKFDFDVYVTVDRATPAWRGHVGVVTTFISRAPFDPATTLALVCGPEVMMRFALMELQHRGVALDRMYLSMERNMKCAVGFCGHCQFGPTFICRDGPIFRFDRIESLFTMPEV